MTKYVAFLRGINVGGRTIKMADLKACFNDMGFKDATTFLQSGNVAFTSNLDMAELKQRIQTDLAKRFSYPAKVIVITLDDLRKIIAANPFTGAPANYHQYVILFESDGLAKDFAAEAVGLEDEEVRSGQNVVYWKVEKGNTLQSQRGKLLTKAKYKEFHTNRNLNTLKKLL